MTSSRQGPNGNLDEDISTLMSEIHHLDDDLSELKLSQISRRWKYRRSPEWKQLRSSLLHSLQQRTDSDLSGTNSPLSRGTTATRECSTNTVDDAVNTSPLPGTLPEEHKVDDLPGEEHHIEALASKSSPSPKSGNAMSVASGQSTPEKRSSTKSGDENGVVGSAGHGESVVNSALGRTRGRSSNRSLQSSQIDIISLASCDSMEAGQANACKWGYSTDVLVDIPGQRQKPAASPVHISPPAVPVADAPVAVQPSTSSPPELDLSATHSETEFVGMKNSAPQDDGHHAHHGEQVDVSTEHLSEHIPVEGGTTNGGLSRIVVDDECYTQDEGNFNVGSDISDVSPRLAGEATSVLETDTIVCAANDEIEVEASHPLSPGDVVTPASPSGTDGSVGSSVADGADASMGPVDVSIGHSRRVEASTDHADNHGAREDVHNSDARHYRDCASSPMNKTSSPGIMQIEDTFDHTWNEFTAEVARLREEVAASTLDFSALSDILQLPGSGVDMGSRRSVADDLKRDVRITSEAPVPFAESPIVSNTLERRLSVDEQADGDAFVPSDTDSSIDRLLAEVDREAELQSLSAVSSEDDDAAGAEKNVSGPGHHDGFVHQSQIYANRPTEMDAQEGDSNDSAQRDDGLDAGEGTMLLERSQVVLDTVLAFLAEDELTMHALDDPQVASNEDALVSAVSPLHVRHSLSGDPLVPTTFGSFSTDDYPYVRDAESSSHNPSHARSPLSAEYDIPSYHSNFGSDGGSAAVDSAMTSPRGVAATGNGKSPKSSTQQHVSMNSSRPVVRASVFIGAAKETLAKKLLKKQKQESAAKAAAEQAERERRLENLQRLEAERRRVAPKPKKKKLKPKKAASATTTTAAAATKAATTVVSPKSKNASRSNIRSAKSGNNVPRQVAKVPAEVVDVKSEESGGDSSPRVKHVSEMTSVERDDWHRKNELAAMKVLRAQRQAQKERERKQKEKEAEELAARQRRVEQVKAEQRARRLQMAKAKSKRVTTGSQDAVNALRMNMQLSDSELKLPEAKKPDAAKLPPSRSEPKRKKVMDSTKTLAPEPKETSGGSPAAQPVPPVQAAVTKARGLLDKLRDVDADETCSKSDIHQDARSTAGASGGANMQRSAGGLGTASKETMESKPTTMLTDVPGDDIIHPKSLFRKLSDAAVDPSLQSSQDFFRGPLFKLSSGDVSGVPSGAPDSGTADVADEAHADCYESSAHESELQRLVAGQSSGAVDLAAGEPGTVESSFAGIDKAGGHTIEAADTDGDTAESVATSPATGQSESLAVAQSGSDLEAEVVSGSISAGDREKCMSFVTTGDLLMKLIRKTKGKGHEKFVKFDHDSKSLLWDAPKSKRLRKQAEVCGIRKGVPTYLIPKGFHASCIDRSFTVLCKGSEENLHFIAEKPEEFRMWLLGIQFHLLSKDQ